MNDTRLLFAARIVRLFAYGFLSVVLVLYLASIGLDPRRIGLLLTLTLVGDVLVSLYLTTRADRIGRRRTLIAGAVLMIVAGVVFAFTHDFMLLLIAATIGVISPSGNEVGPFLAVEQVALTQAEKSRDRTAIFAWYNLAGSFATAMGSLCGGVITSLMMRRGFDAASSYRVAIVTYALLGFALIFIFAKVSAGVEARDAAVGPAPLFGVRRSRGIVARLSALFTLDAFAGGLVVQSVVAYWFFRRWGVSPAVIGGIFFGANLFAGISALAAARIARRFGLIKTMVFTHLPSNIFLLLVPFMPTLPLAIAVLLIRFSISQMDVPTRQSYVIAVVDESERTAAAGVTGVARTTGAAFAPVFAVPLIASASHDWMVFVAAGALKILYDILLLWSSLPRLSTDAHATPGAQNRPS
jgi:MFS family permease